MVIDRIKENYLREKKLSNADDYSDQHWKILMKKEEENLFNLDSLKNFRRNELSFGFDNSNPSSISYYKKDTIELFEKLKDKISPNILNYINEEMIGNPLTVHYDSYVFSRSSIEFAYLASKIYKYIKNNSILIEVGGGYGGLARIIKCLFPRITYIIVDLPEANVISSYYLSKTFSQDKIFYSTELSDKEIFHINKNKYDFIFLSPRHLNKLGDQSIDFVINTRSMMEMNYTTINYYFNSIKRIIKNEGFFYLVNRYQKISFLKNYPFGQKWEIVLSKNWPTYIDTNPCHELLLKRTDNYNNELIELLNTFPPYGFTNIKHKIKKYLVDKKIIKHWRGKVA